MKYILPFCCFIGGSLLTNAQISGDLQANVNFFQRDTAIKASDNPLYDNLLSGGESWLGLRYNGPKGFNANIRLDGFQNSNLLNPLSAYTGVGIGMYNVSKEWDNLTVTGGYIYDQIGSGILFRAYEDRGLLIDNALIGLHAKYKFSEQLTMKAMTGQTRNLFDRFKPIIKAVNFEGDFDFAKGKGHLTPGIAVLNKTLDDGAMNTIVGKVNDLPEGDRFVPTYNMYGGTIYNTLNIGEFSVYTEAALKSKDAILNQVGDLISKPGSVLYANAGWARGKIGINGSIKRTKNFVMRTSPYEAPLRGFVNWQPVIALIRPQRTIARYTPQSIDISEFSKAINMFYVPNDNYTINGSFTHINDLEGNKLYRELYVDGEIRSIKKTILHVGFQNLYYNRDAYVGKGKDVKAFTSFAEITYKFSPKRSLKADLQYMNAKGDFGSWAYALLEYDIAPHWAFALGDMYNTAKGANLDIHPGLRAQHYPNVFVGYTQKAHRFTAQYVKQVEGINCTGGVCRYEPAFSGFKIGISSSF
jgi:Family of unknown function (DUF6029)